MKGPDAPCQRSAVNGQRPMETICLGADGVEGKGPWPCLVAGESGGIAEQPWIRPYGSSPMGRWKSVPSDLDVVGATRRGARPWPPRGKKEDPQSDACGPFCRVFGIGCLV